MPTLTYISSVIWPVLFALGYLAKLTRRDSYTTRDAAVQLDASNATHILITIITIAATIDTDSATKQSPATDTMSASGYWNKLWHDICSAAARFVAYPPAMYFAFGIFVLFMSLVLYVLWYWVQCLQEMIDEQATAQESLRQECASVRDKYITLEAMNKKLRDDVKSLESEKRYLKTQRDLARVQFHDMESAHAAEAQKAAKLAKTITDETMKLLDLDQIDMNIDVGNEAHGIIQECYQLLAEGYRQALATISRINMEKSKLRELLENSSHEGSSLFGRIENGKGVEASEGKQEEATDDQSVSMATPQDDCYRP